MLYLGIKCVSSNDPKGFSLNPTETQFAVPIRQEPGCWNEIVPTYAFSGWKKKCKGEYKPRTALGIILKEQHAVILLQDSSAVIQRSGASSLRELL